MRGQAANRLRVAILGEEGGWHMRRLLEACAARGHDATPVRWADLGAAVGASVVPTPPSGQAAAAPPLPAASAAAVEHFLPPALEAADVVVVRGMPGGGLEEVIFRMDVLGRLAARGTPVINHPRGLEIAIDKYLSLSLLAAAGLPVPRTMVVQQPGEIRAAWQMLGGDCIAKPIFGSGGRGMSRITAEKDLAPLLDGTSSAGPAAGVVYLQEFVPHGGWDLRVVVVGDETFAIRRVGAAGDWRTNIARGGRAEPWTPPPDWIELARAAAHAVRVDVAGVDLLPAADGRVLVLEVNAVPGWRGLQAATGIDVADRVVRHLERL
jgi:ribosomal protein S6--L-glutamate ligase